MPERSPQTARGQQSPEVVPRARAQRIDRAREGQGGQHQNIGPGGSSVGLLHWSREVGSARYECGKLIGSYLSHDRDLALAAVSTPSARGT
jgi:hypothetical protein